MGEHKLNQLVNQITADKLGFSDVRERIKGNLQFLAEHPILNKTVFIHEDQELVKNYLETVEALISDQSSEENIESFLNLFDLQIVYLKEDFGELYKLVSSENGEITLNLTINSKNFFNDPFDDSDKPSFEKEQKIVVLVHRIKHGVMSLLDVAKQFRKLYEAVNKALPPILSDALQQLNEELVSFRRNRNIADNAKTENIYDQAVIKYRGLENSYRKTFYLAIGITVGLSLLGLFLKKWLVPNYLGNIEFWVLKVSILVVGVTLITYFLKQSSHYQRLADQNYQTQVELQAYPTFMESIPTEEAASVRKELALKYFGREIDGAAHKDMSNLISEQMKSTTDMVKAATDALKVKG